MKRGMSNMEKKAKMKVLGDMNGMASDAIKDKLGGLKKVTVAAPSEEGLKKGLDMAKKITKVIPEDEEYDSMDENEYGDDEMLGEQDDKDEMMGEKEKMMAEGYEDEMDESMPMSAEEIDEEIQRLLAIKDSLKP